MFKKKGGASSGTGLTTAQAAILSKFSLNEITKVIRVTYSLNTGLNSFGLGEKFKMHSASSTVFTEDRANHINWGSIRYGIRPFTALGEHITIKPTVPDYSAPFSLLTNGINPTANSVPYTASVPLNNNECILRLEVMAGEDYTGEVTYTIKNNDENGINDYKQVRQVEVLQGESVVFNFTYQGDDTPFSYGHPSQNLAGTTIHVEMKKANGEDFLVMSGTDDSVPWLNLYLMTFTELQIKIDTPYQIYEPDGFDIIIPNEVPTASTVILKKLGTIIGGHGELTRLITDFDLRGVDQVAGNPVSGSLIVINLLPIATADQYEEGVPRGFGETAPNLATIARISPNFSGAMYHVGKGAIKHNGTTIVSAHKAVALRGLNSGDLTLVSTDYDNMIDSAFANFNLNQEFVVCLYLLNNTTATIPAGTVAGRINKFNLSMVNATSLDYLEHR